MKIKDFKTSEKCRKTAYGFCISAAIYLACFQEKIGAVILLSIAVYFAFQYKCPYCQKTLDTRNAHRNIKHCPHCGELLERQDTK